MKHLLSYICNTPRNCRVPSWWWWGVVGFGAGRGGIIISGTTPSVQIFDVVLKFPCLVFPVMKVERVVMMLCHYQAMKSPSQLNHKLAQ